MKIKNLLLVMIVVTGFYSSGFAQQPVIVASATPIRKTETKKTELILAAEEPEEKPKVTISGYIDSYYLHAFNNPKSGNLMGSGNVAGPYFAGRAFDRLTDQFALGLVQTKFMYSDKKSDLVVDLTFGPNAELGNFGNQRLMQPGGYVTGFYPTNGNQSALYGTSAAIKQAYFTYKATDKLSFTVGQFGTHIGYEVIDAPVNYHYSLSNLFNNGPFYHIGAKAQYAFSGSAYLMVGVVNNWDALTDWKKQKSLISQFYFKPVEGWNVYVNWIGGHNDDGFKAGTTGAGTTSVGNLAYTFLTSGYSRNLFDLTTGYQMTPKFYVGLNAAYGMYNFKGGSNLVNPAGGGGPITETAYITGLYQKLTPTWYGVAFYTNYAISDVVGIGARYEHFSDKYMVRYIGAVNNSLTITAPITVADGHLIIKPELRIDTSAGGVKYYEDSNGNPTAQQTTLGAAFIYKY